MAGGAAAVGGGHAGSPVLPLSGLSVLELPGDVATRYCGRLFACGGAAVTAVGERDDDGIGYGGAGGRAYGRWLDEGKAHLGAAGAGSLDVDLVIAGQDDEAVRAAGELLTAAGPGGPLLLGLRWFDPRGPYGSWLGSDELVHALTGVAYSFGTAAGPPTVPQGHGPQIVAGANAYAVALAALLAPPGHRPSVVETTVHESYACVAEMAAIATVDDGSPPSVRLGVNRFVPTYPCSSYRTADGWVGVTCLTPAQWAALCAAIGREDVIGERRFSTSFRRLLAGDEVDDLLRPPFAARTTAAWVQEGIARRIPIAPMEGPGAVLQQEHWVARGAFAPVAGGTTAGPTPPFRISFGDAGETRSVRREEGHDDDGHDDGTPGPLAGLRVVDLTMGWAGPLATRLLADLGADVVKVESRGHPDWYRGWEADKGGDPPAIELRSSFNALNRGKRGVALELTRDEGLAAAKALVAEADVVVESFAAGVLDKLGLGQAVQRALRADVISLSMPAFGGAGPLSAVRAYGSTVEQASGLPFVNGEAGWDPCLQHVAIGDPIAGVYAAAAVLTALAGRHRLGGSVVDLSQVACLFQVAADAVIEEQVAGRPVPRTGSRRARCEVWCVPAGAVPGGAVPGGAGSAGAGPAGGAPTGGGSAGAEGDEWLLVVLPDGSRREALHQLLVQAGAPADGPVSEVALASWAVGRPADRSAATLQAAGVPAAPVLRASALGSDPQLAATGFWQALERPHVGRHTSAAPAFRFDGVRPAPRRPAPTLGQHTDEVVAELTRG